MCELLILLWLAAMISYRKSAGKLIVSEEALRVRATIDQLRNLADLSWQRSGQSVLPDVQ